MNRKIDIDGKGLIRDELFSEENIYQALKDVGYSDEEARKLAKYYSQESLSNSNTDNDWISSYENSSLWRKFSFRKISR